MKIFTLSMLCFGLLFLPACRTAERSQVNSTPTALRPSTFIMVVNDNPSTQLLYPQATLAREVTKCGIADGEPMIILVRGVERRFVSVEKIKAMLLAKQPQVLLKPGDKIVIKTRPRELRRLHDAPNRVIKDVDDAT